VLENVYIHILALSAHKRALFIRFHINYFMTTCGRKPAILVLQDATGARVAKAALRLPIGNAIFARAEFHSQISWRKEGACLASAHATENGVLLLALPLLPSSEGTHRQKYIYAEVEGRNFTFSLPSFFAMEHRELYNILAGALGMEFDIIGGGRIYFEAGKVPRAAGISGNFDLHDTNFEANGAISAFVSSFGGKFAAFCKKSGFPAVGKLVRGS